VNSQILDTMIGVSSNVSQELALFEKMKEQIEYQYQSYERGPSLLRVCDMT
jgi:hypothetical protein